MATQSFWRQQARLAITEATKDLPSDCDPAERKQTVDAAYPFGPRKYHPYKMWLIERRAYLAEFGLASSGKQPHETPLERLIRRGKEAEARGSSLKPNEYVERRP